MKKILGIILALAMVFALAACGGSTTPPASTSPSSTPSASTPPASTPPASTPPASTPPASAPSELGWNPDNIREHNFILAHGMTEQNVVSKCYHAFCEYVNQLSDGKIKIDERIGGTLLTDLETFDGLLDGTADFIHSMGSYVSSTVKDISPLTIAGYYGGDNWLDFAKGTKDLVGQIYADYDIKYLGALYQGTSVIACSKKQIKQPEDIKGLAFRASGEWVSKTMEAWGGAAQNVSLPNLADAFQKGTVEGVVSGWTIIGGWGIYEVAKYLTTTDVTEGFAALLMNGDTWASLNADEQALIEKAGDMFVENNYTLTIAECQRYYDQVVAEGRNEIYEMPAADSQNLIRIANGLYTDMAAGGTLGPKGLQLIDMLKQYNGIS